MSSVRVGVVGFGWFGAIHCQSWLSMDGVELAGVCDSDPTRFQEAPRGDLQSDFHVEADEITRTLPDSVARYSDVDALLAQDIDVLDVVVPETMHAEMVRRALQAGKDAIVEKPMALHPSEVRELMSLADERGRNIYVGHILRFDARNAALAATLGAERPLHMSFQRNFQTVAHDVYGRIHPVFGASIHDLDLAVWYAGSRPSAVSAHASSFFEREHPDVLDIVLHWEDGLRAVVQNSWHLPSSCPYGFEFECKIQTPSSVLAIRNQPDLEVWDSRGVQFPEVHFWPIVHGGRRGAIRGELEHFAHCVRAQMPSPIVPLEQVLWTTELADAVLRSVDLGEGRLVKL